jgi:hypothetical protein
MITNRSLVGIACRAAAFSFLVAGSASLLQAQQSPSVPSTANAPLLLAAESAPFGPSGMDLSASSSSSSSSASDSPVASDGHFLFNSAAALDSSQPPPRRYGRPNYSDSHSNPDGSNKYFFLGGIGLTLPVGDTHYYETPSYGFQFGGGRNFNKNIGVGLQFDYDHFGLQSATIQNQEYVYNYGCTTALQSSGACSLVTGLGGNNHVWSFTLNPTYTISTEGSMGAYVVVGGGFYHKVTNFTLPTTECADYYCEFQYSVDENVDHYSSNAGGVSGGFGLTYKFSHFSNERFYMEARYVLMLNSQRTGYTAQNVATTSYDGYDAYPANSNRTTYIPIKFGIRF